MFKIRVLSLALTLMGSTVSVEAQGDFFRSNDLEIVLPASAGGSYGTYGQLVADHLGRHILGEPTVTLNFMRGAGGLRATNYIAKAAPRDGSVIYLMHQNAPTSQILSSDAAQYDVSEFPPIGRISSSNAVMVVSDKLGAQTVTDLVAMLVVAGSTGRGSYTYIVPSILNETIGTDFNLVTTYGGSSEVLLAMEREEVQMFMTSTLSLKRRHADWAVGNGGAKVILQVGSDRDPDFADIPLLTELQAEPNHLEVFRFISASHGIARSLVAVPGTPQEQVTLLRDAFEAMLSDPLFISDADRRGIPVISADAQFVGATINEIIGTPSSVVELPRRIVGEQ